ncbi:MAG: peptidoglycan-associated lipoprotein [Zetaproteobacteria bacterium CG1_02_55_237]|nr:MAG: peptidoglycan-associated lipoprotein [Zetaproteobacteria bacterium CG1_02_55_237]
MKFNKYSTLAIAVFAAAGLMMGGCAKKTVEGGGHGGASVNKVQTGDNGDMSGLPAERAVYFAFDKSEITDQGASILNANAAWLKAHPQRTATVEGNCDERGEREYNLALGQRRADSVKAYLVAHGVAAGNINTVSFGEENPVCRGTGDNCWSQNRRADIVVR